MAEIGEIRAGERQLDFDPATRAEAGVVFVGRIRSRWQPGDAPRNLRQAREADAAARIELVRDYVPALDGLEPGQAIWVLYWADRARRDLVVQSPRHADGPRGTFGLRSPVRPNPVIMAAVRITDIDHDKGAIGIDTIDAFDGTPVIDIKPWIPAIDMPPGT